MQFYCCRISSKSKFQSLRFRCNIESDDIFNTLVSVNQQTNYYEAENGFLQAGPAPEMHRICHISTNDNTQDMLNQDPIIVAGDFRERHYFSKGDILAQQINASTVTSHGLSKVLENCCFRAKI